MIRERTHELIHFFLQLLTSKRFMSNPLKYTLLCAFAAFIHLFFAISFGAFKIEFLSLYNIAIFVFYISLGIYSYNTDDFFRIYLLTIIEIEIHSAMATILLGWDFNFMMYTVAFVPGAFYLENSLKIRHRRFATAALASIFIAVCYFVTNIICYFYKPVYSGLADSFPSRFFFFVNNFIGFSVLLAFSLLFALEIQYFGRILRQENSKLGEIANIDPLTSLMNRRGMSSCIDNVVSEISESDESMCLIMADIDHFKKINDTYGHDMGDKVLEDIGHILSTTIRKADYACRWGGEEFLILIRGNSDDAFNTALRIKEQINALQYSSGDSNFSITITMGISEYQKGIQVSTLISLADQKLYYGKEHGRNQIVL